jgi:transcriptional regulator with XRE-family HTH domain
MTDNEAAALLASLRATIKRMGWTQKRLAAALGITAAALSRQLHGTRPLALPTLLAISDCLGVPFRDLFGPGRLPERLGDQFLSLWAKGLPADRAFDVVFGDQGQPLSAAEREKFRALGPAPGPDLTVSDLQRLREALARARKLSLPPAEDEPE